MQAVDGKTMSGVDVATMIRSTSSAAAAGGLQRVARGGQARSLALTPASAKWRARMPVRSTIQASLVSMPRAASIAPGRRWSGGAAAGGCRCR
jgi:hypothetical protein